MDKLPEHDRLGENMTDAALRYLKLGYRPIPVHPGQKSAAVKWKRFQTEVPSEEEIWHWFHEGDCNIALVTGNGLVVVDVDAADQGLLEEIVEHVGDTPMRTRTPSGGTHLYYRMRAGVHYGNAVKVKGKPIDLRCEGGYVCAPWSRTGEGSYQWLGEILPVSELPLLRVSWLREREKKRPLQQIEPSENIDVMVRRAKAYLSRVEGGISGQRGHSRCMRAAGILVQKFGLSVEAALPVLAEWNESSCEPPFSEKELIHKLSDAYRLRFERGLKRIE